MQGVTVACIGPVTADVAEAAGIKVDIMPKNATVPEMAEAIASYYN